MGRRRRRGWSAGSLLALLLCLLAIGGFFYFLNTVGRDSPAVAMRPEEVVEVVSRGLPQAAARQSGQPQAAAAVATTAPAATPQAGPISLRLTLGGTLRAEQVLQNSLPFEEGGLRAVLQPIERFLHGDLTALALDQVVAQESSRGSALPILALQGLKQLGVDALLLPGNRLFDQGMDIARQTPQHLVDQRLLALGAGTPVATKLRINGLNIAWLHAGEVLSSQGNKATKADERAGMLAPIHSEQLEMDIRALKQESDLVVVSLNWKSGDRPSPTALQGTIAHRLGAAGADVIIGYGTQVQQVEVYRLPQGEGQRDILIAYSLGNVLRQDRNSVEQMTGLVLTMDLIVTPGQGMHLNTLTYVPTHTRKWSVQGKQHFQVLHAAQEPPADMNNSQKNSMEKSRLLVQTAMEGSPAQLQR